MTACDDIIDFDLPDEWKQIASIVQNAQSDGEDSYVPIPQIDLGVSIDNSYIAVFATTTEGIKSTWRYAGEIRQVYDFSPGAGNSTLNKIQTEATPLFINKLQIVEAKRVSDVSFGLRYQPPAWFRDCGIRVWRYTGERRNFVKDTLFNIGNAVGAPDSPLANEPILNALTEFSDAINAKIDTLQQALDDSYIDLTNDNEEIIQQINEVDAGIFTLAEGLGLLLPPDQAANLRTTTQQRLSLDLGFL